MNNLLELIKQLNSVKAQQKDLEKKESTLKDDLLTVMKGLNTEKEDSDYGTVRLQYRYEKKYSQAVQDLEARYKEYKKLAEDLGDYEVVGTKESIVFIPPKDVF